MKQIKNRLRDGIGIFTGTHNTYKRLQKHFNKQPIGFPATITGVERRILSSYFTVDEAEIALFLSYKFQSAGRIFENVRHQGVTEEQLQNMLDNMEKNGAIFVNIIDGKKQYALAPFVIGMIDQKVHTMDARFVLDYRKYAYQSYVMEHLTTSHPQGRVIPIQKAVTPDMQIATYDEIRELVRQREGHICVAECFCRVGKDKIGRHCLATDRRDVCLVVGDFGDQYIRNGLGQAISSEEALEILAENEKEGLVLQTSNCQKSIWICSCCKCCCGLLELVSFLPKPAAFVGSNYYATLDADQCTGDGKCVEKCTTEAITLTKKKTVRINRNRCLGCGVCVATCETGALSLKKKETPYVPPENLEMLFEEILKDKKGPVGRVLHLGRKFIGR
ncbi:MAG: 4Fe-4S binding protein [Thermodesulfobacteriota bacterium]|nr:4Fe-4S binding protein [Thermodesulfobacteriota bacterium]